MVDSSSSPVAQLTLAEALSEYLLSLKPDLRTRHENFVRKYVEHVGDHITLESLSAGKVESYAEAQIKASDPNSPDRVVALKAWFQYLKKKEYTATNLGVHIRVRRVAGRAGSSQFSRPAETAVEMTADGLEALKVELGQITEQRVDLVRAIELARQDGDLRENAPYHAAREALAFSERRQKQIENALKRAVVVDRGTDDRSSVGSTVTVTNLQDDQQFHYKLVGAREANAAEKKISVDSPVGKQLLGRTPGEKVKVTTPRGDITFRIDAVAHST